MWLLSYEKYTTLVEHQVLYTPQYESWLQSIEMVWATVKKLMAMLARSDASTRRRSRSYGAC